MKGLSRNAKGHWVATHLGKRVTFTEQRFGEAAEHLARRALLAMQAGTYNERDDNAMLKLSYGRDMAAMQWGIHVGELNTWLLTGCLRGKALPPPRFDNRQGAGKISGYEMVMVQARIQALFAPPSSEHTSFQDPPTRGVQGEGTPHGE